MIIGVSVRLAFIALWWVGDKRGVSLHTHVRIDMKYHLFSNIQNPRCN